MKMSGKIIVAVSESLEHPHWLTCFETVYSASSTFCFLVCSCSECLGNTYWCRKWYCLSLLLPFKLCFCVDPLPKFLPLVYLIQEMPNTCHFACVSFTWPYSILFLQVNDSVNYGGVQGKTDVNEMQNLAFLPWLCFKLLFFILITFVADF